MSSFGVTSLQIDIGGPTFQVLRVVEVIPPRRLRSTSSTGDRFLHDSETEENMLLLWLDRKRKVCQRLMRWNCSGHLLRIFLSPRGLVGGLKRFRWEGRLLETPQNSTPTGCSINSNINLCALRHQITWCDSFNRYKTGRMKTTCEIGSENEACERQSTFYPQTYLQ